MAPFLFLFFPSFFLLQPACSALPDPPAPERKKKEGEPSHA
ncbi:hypothetical protein SLEP1_g22789 [Rubroshorea leprosula]|uniref:Uncharacterized protein n=1 Tax=Rubroshorea leprosula TaxID=152421 RepID=A0AAV5JHK3_9ROSI|nr:hypothetical protein SLEP1_g22789 [Rubroshorea leprosula]